MGSKAIIITARLGSSRLPDKHIKEINGRFCIELMMERVKRSKRADKVILCTTILREDDVLCELANRYDIECFRGSVEDKLERWNGAAQKYDVDFFVTADADDLFCEPELIDLAFGQYDRTGADFIEWDQDNLICGAFTYGIKAKALKKVCETKETEDTEMMWVFFTPELFKVEKLKNVPDVFNRPEIRATLDYEEDLEFFRNMYSFFKHNDFSLRDVVDVLDDFPEITQTNSSRHTDWKDRQEERIKEMTEKGNKYPGSELNYLTKVLNSESWSSTEGSWTNTLESKFAVKFGARYAVAMNSGTSVLHAALVACGVRPGDEVVTPAITVFMDTSAIIHCNAIPVYADVREDTLNIDPEDVVKKITPKTKAIIAVSLYGLECDIPALMKLANEYDIPLIIDNAQHMGKHKAHITTYSFENSKHISCGEGGIAITDSEAMATCMRKLSNHGFKNSTAEEGRTKLNIDEFQSPYYKRHSVVGWNYRLSEFCAAVALAQLERVDELVSGRRAVARAYMDVLDEEGRPGLVPQASSSDHTYWAFAVKLQGWADFRKLYRSYGGDGFYGAWSIPYMEPAMQNRTFVRINPEIYKDIGYNAGLCPVAEIIQRSIAQFKTNYRTQEEMRSQAEALRKTLRVVAGKKKRH